MGLQDSSCGHRSRSLMPFTISRYSIRTAVAAGRCCWRLRPGIAVSGQPLQPQRAAAVDVQQCLPAVAVSPT